MLLDIWEQGTKKKKEKGMKVIGKIVKGDDYLLDIREYLGSEAGNDECDNLEIFETWETW